MNELDSESRQLLALARTARTPSADDQARVARRLRLAVGVSAGAAATVAGVQVADAAASGVMAGGGAAVETAGMASAATGVQAPAALNMFKAGATWSSLKVGIAGALLLSAAAGVYLGVARRPDAPRSAASVAGPRAPAAAADALTAVDRAAPERAAGPTPPIAATTSAKSLVADANATSSDPQGRREAQGTGGDDGKARSRHTATLGSELELLHRAQVAWRARAAPRALELLQQHRKRYPRSELRSEREALQVLVLCEVGQSKQAARLAAALLKREPESPARAAIEQSCATK
jgi:hypothetical protein